MLSDASGKSSSGWRCIFEKCLRVLSRLKKCLAMSSKVTRFSKRHAVLVRVIYNSVVGLIHSGGRNALTLCNQATLPDRKLCDKAGASLHGDMVKNFFIIGII